MSRRSANLLRLLRSAIDPRAYAHAWRVVNFYNYAHVAPRRQMTIGNGVRISPNASFREGHHIEIGDRTHIGERCMLWAGDQAGRIVVGDDCLFGPEVLLTASNYTFGPGLTTRDAPKRQADIVIGRNVWLGARAIVTAGVRIGDNCVIGAGAVVTKDVPDGCVAAGVPARILQHIDGTSVDVDLQLDLDQQSPDKAGAN